MIIPSLFRYIGKNHARLFSASEIAGKLENVIETIPNSIFMIMFRRSIDLDQEEKRSMVLVESPYRLLITFISQVHR
jgi:hypothetical protein